MERERSQRREGAATWLWIPKEKQRTTSTKRRVNRNMPQNRLGRMQKPDTNLLLCFKASSVHPPPSPFQDFPPSSPLWNSPVPAGFGRGAGRWLQRSLACCQLFLKKERVHLSVPIIPWQRQRSARHVPLCAFVPSASSPCKQSQPKSSGGGRASRRQGMLAGGAWRADPPHS